MYKTNSKYDYDKIYGRIMGMCNSGHTVDEIAYAMSLSKMFVIDVIQKAYGRSKMYRG